MERGEEGECMIYFFRPFPLPLAAGVPLEDTLTARDVCAELALLPPLTASRVLFCINRVLAQFPRHRL